MDHFDRVYCIHFPDPCRRQAIELEFEKVGITDVSYVYAQRPNMRRAPAAEFAVNLSHIKAVSHAIADRAECPVFFEDDVVFRDYANNILNSAWEALPDDWDVLYMGGHPCDKVEQLSPNLVKVKRFSFAESYAINGVALRPFHDFWFDRIGSPMAMYDRILGEFAEQNNGYCVYPVLTHQPEGYSHIAGRDDDKRDLVSRGWVKNLT
jgi:GR25 family glycosyltransferase involved in LPS biosynthesis